MYGKVLPHRSHLDASGRNLLLGGQPVQLLHKEADGALAWSAACAHVHVAAGHVGKGSSNTLWEFERAERGGGLPLQVSDT